MFDVLSPDGLSIFPNRVYQTLDEALGAAEAFAQGFDWQGFYSTAMRECIPLDDIVGRCRVIRVNPLEDQDEDT